MGPSEVQQTIAHGDPIAPVIFGVTLILAAALVGRYAARRLDQPSVLGELLMGMLLGNLLYFFHYDLIVILREGTACIDIAALALAGETWEAAAVAVLGPDQGPRFLGVVQTPGGGDYLKVAQVVDVFSRYGVIFLLFHVGLDTCVAELKRVGLPSLRVAVIGVLAPFALGFSIAWFLTPGSGHAEHMFLAATLSATSIGITARVLNDLNRQHSREAHIVIGAAVMDDILGLVMLAIVSGIVVTGSLEVADVSRTVALSLLFIVSALMLGPHLITLLIRLLHRMDVLEAKLFVSFIYVMLLAWAANLVGLATIVGAFAAGLLLMDSQFSAWGDHRDHKYTIKELFAPLESILVPIFFVLMGIQVKLETFLDWKVVSLAVGLLCAAVLGKLVAGLGAPRALRRLAVGVGMMPRGEVGLVFASIGRSLDVVDNATFSAIVLMVIVTTLVTPPWLKRLLGQGDPEEAEAARASQGKRPCD